MEQRRTSYREGKRRKDNEGPNHSIGDFRETIEFSEQCLKFHRQVGDRREEGKDLVSLGLAYYSTGSQHRAIQCYEQALLVNREIGDRHGQAADMNSLGLAYAALGDTRKSLGYYEGALAIFREVGDRKGQVCALGNLGNVYCTLLQAIYQPSAWEGIATHKPPSCDLNATLMRP